MRALLGCDRTECGLGAFLLLMACVQGAFVEPLQPDIDLLSFSDNPTRLPCQYQVAQDQSVVQVTWNKELPDGSEDPVIMAHFTEGNREFGRYSGRVKFESFTPITENSALLIPATQESDEGIYRCHITTFPNGNFERRIKLTVWSTFHALRFLIHLTDHVNNVTIRATFFLF
ncbi:hypothetical protein XENOCAPTIV_015160 [Xenoophorus captivus]|uniref:Ig-like domain-containing protein n=1 Tax=Xenoophorus captivus TaxID=1517983 RepID=A0ABV0Q3R0_9TELE